MKAARRPPAGPDGSVPAGKHASSAGTDPDLDYGREVAGRIMAPFRKALEQYHASLEERFAAIEKEMQELRRLIARRGRRRNVGR